MLLGALRCSLAAASAELPPWPTRLGPTPGSQPPARPGPSWPVITLVMVRTDSYCNLTLTGTVTPTAGCACGQAAIPALGPESTQLTPIWNFAIPILKTNYNGVVFYLIDTSLIPGMTSQWYIFYLYTRYLPKLPFLVVYTKTAFLY